MLKVPDFLGKLERDLQGARSVSEIQRIVKGVAVEADFTDGAYALAPIVASAPTEERNTLIHQLEWMRQYFSRKCPSSHPTVTIESGSLLPQGWFALEASGSFIFMFHDAESEQSDESPGRYGITISAKGSNNQVGFCTFSSDVDAVRWKRLIQTRMIALVLAANAIHLRVMSLAGAQPLTLLHTLSSRELDSLTLCAGGISDRDIARILGVSKVAVSAYLASACYKLCSATRGGAIQKALDNKLIKPEVLLERDCR